MKPAGFFVLRTPTLPWDEVISWSTGLAARSAYDNADDLKQAVREDERILRARLRTLVERPVVRSAILVASPSLHARLTSWLYGADSDETQRTERTIVRYVMRMASRSTPFGLFSGIGVGAIGRQTHLQVPPISELKRHTRLDMGLVFDVVQQLSMDHGLRQELRYEATTMAYKVGDYLRYYDTRVSNNLRSYHLVDVTPSPYLDSALRYADRPSGARILDIARAIQEESPDVNLDQAMDYVHELIDANLLFPAIEPRVTGLDPLWTLVRHLSGTLSGKPVAEALKSLALGMEEIDESRIADAPAQYAALAREFQDRFRDLGHKDVFRVDAHKPASNMTLGKNIVEDVSRCLDVLARIARPEPDPFEAFIKKFVERYQQAEVPLLHAMDSDAGLGFPGLLEGSDFDAPLLAGLAFTSPDNGRDAWGRRDRFLLQKLGESLASRSMEIRLGAGDIQALSHETANVPREAPPGLFAVLSIASKSKEDFAAGKFQIHLQHAAGPSSCSLITRFCHGDTALAESVRATLAQEDMNDDGVIHAEIVHLPHGRVGNVVTRPVLREYEIPVAGGASVPADKQVRLSDIVVSVRHGKIVLRSVRHGRQIRPHLTCAHDFRHGGLDVYRFLASVERQEMQSDYAFDWGALITAPFLPRVVHHKFVLALAQWSIPGERFKVMASMTIEDRFTAIQHLRAELALPRYVFLLEAGNALLVDLENILSIASFLSIARRCLFARVTELFTDPENTVVDGKQGRFHHEIIIPFVKIPTPPAQRTISVVRAQRETVAATRNFPGSEWLFVKAYCGETSLDYLLKDIISPLIAELRAQSSIDRWFFIRYGDPDWHLRLRLRADPDQLWKLVAPKVFSAIASAPQGLHRISVDTYTPEETRYGGKAAMDLAERIFQADSEAALKIIGAYGSDADFRWRMALVGIDALLNDFQMSLADKIQVMCQCRDSQIAKNPEYRRLVHGVGQKYRAMRREIEDLLAGALKDYEAGMDTLGARTQEVAPIVQSLLLMDRMNTLNKPITEVLGNLVHMWANRIFASQANTQELVLYEYLRRHYQSKIAFINRG